MFLIVIDLLGFPLYKCIIYISNFQADVLNKSRKTNHFNHLVIVYLRKRRCAPDTFYNQLEHLNLSKKSPRSITKKLLVLSSESMKGGNLICSKHTILTNLFRWKDINVIMWRHATKLYILVHHHTL